jgi:tetratricopeptide (TPR) repeat protein
MEGNTEAAIKLIGMAVTYAERLARDRPGDVRYKQLLAQSLVQSTETTWHTKKWLDGVEASGRAVEAYRSLPASSEEDRSALATLLYVHAHFLRIAGRLADAELPAREAIALSQAQVADFPRNAYYRASLARSHQEMSHVLLDLEGRAEEAGKHHSQAVEHWEQAVAGDGSVYHWREYISMHGWWGRSVRDREPAEAVTSLAAAASAAAAAYERFDHVDEFRNLYAERLVEAGNAYRDLGEPAKALDSFDRAVELRPDEPVACDALSAMLADGPDETARDPKRAVELARMAIARDPKSGKYRGTLGAALLRAGDLQSAVAELTEASNLGAENGRELLYLAMAQWRLGEEKGKAREVFDRAVAWIDKHAPQDKALARLRAQAAKLLGVPSPEPPDDKQPGAAR